MTSYPSGPASSAWPPRRCRPATSTGDFDIDGKTDLAVVTSQGAKTQLWTLRSTGTSFANRVLGWEQALGGQPVTSWS